MGNRVDFDKFTSNYNELLNQETRFFSPSEEYFARYKTDIVRKQVFYHVSRVLEYGCGIGRNIPFLQHAFPEAVIVGSDISNASLVVARRENMGIDFIQESEAVPTMEPFDLIFVAGVFHHVPMELRPQVARTLYERLSPGGSLFVFEHNPFNPVTRRIVSNCPYDEDAVLLKPSELIGLLGQASLTIERKSYCLFVPPKLSLLARLESRLGWLPLGGQYWIQAKRNP